MFSVLKQWICCRGISMYLSCHCSFFPPLRERNTEAFFMKLNNVYKSIASVIHSADTITTSPKFVCLPYQHIFQKAGAERVEGNCGECLYVLMCFASNKICALIKRAFWRSVLFSSRSRLVFPRIEKGYEGCGSHTLRRSWWTFNIKF